jgi:hypothetical protein
MIPDKIFRGVLWATVVFNVGGAMLFLFPSSSLGQLAGLPAPVPAVYTALLAEFVLLFAGGYAWLALQPTIDRALVGFAAIGKTGAFLVITGFWLTGAVPARGVLAASGDLIFACIFAWWLLAPASTVAAVASPDAITAR